MDDVRSMIREVLREELARIKSSSVRAEEEVVTIGSDIELGAFVQKILELGNDATRKADILAGRYVFKLRQISPQNHLEANSVVATHTPSPRVRFSKSMITERDVAGFPDGTVAIMTDKKVRLTPLARDEIRRRGIQLEKVAR
ncbi:MAG: hypothetical protein ACI8P9_003453 [Parasphingorhabdus sp.]|jgi:hypothetical protein